MRHFVLISAGCAALLTGCGDKSAMPDNVAPAVAAIDIDGVNGADIAMRFEAVSRKTSDADAQSALQQLSLWDESDTVSWDMREGKSGDYVFTNLTLDMQDNSPPLTSGRVELIGLHLENGRAAAESLSIDDLKVEDEDAILTIANVLLADVDFGDFETLMQGSELDEATHLPNAGATAFTGFRLAVAHSPISESFENDFAVVAPNETTPKNEQEDVSADNGPNIAPSAQESIIATIESGAWADASSVEARDGFFDMDGLSVSFTDHGQDNRLTLDTAYAHGIIALQPIMEAAQARARGETLPDNLTLFPKEIMLQPIQGFGLTGFKLDSPEIEMALDAVTFSSEKRGNRLEGESRIKGFVITPGKDDDPSEDSFTNAMAELGYDALRFSGDAESRLDLKNDRLSSESSLVMQDGFELNLDVDYKGAVAMAELYSDMFNQLIRSDDNVEALATRFGMAQMGLTPAF